MRAGYYMRSYSGTYDYSQLDNYSLATVTAILHSKARRAYHKLESKSKFKAGIMKYIYTVFSTELYPYNVLHIMSRVYNGDIMEK